MNPPPPPMRDRDSYPTGADDSYAPSLRQSAEDFQDDEISLGEIFESLVGHWKKLVGGALAGLLIGLASWTFSAYQAELTINIGKSAMESKSAIDFVSWRNLAATLPSLAEELVQRGDLKANDEALFRQMARPDWWKKNVVPTYAISKSDAKDLAAIGKELQESGATSIVNLVIRDANRSKEIAVARTYEIASFIRTGGAFVDTKSLIRHYELEAQALVSTTQKSITNHEVELAHMKKRAENLERLSQRFPGNAGAAVQNVVDAKDSAAKYLPISTQLVAVNTEINNTQEALTRLRDRLAQQQLFDDFLKIAAPALDQERDGMALIETLLAAEQGIRKAIDKTDIRQVQVVDRLSADLIEIRTRYNTSFENPLAPTVHRPTPTLPVALGLVGGSLLTLLVVLVINALRTHREKRAGQEARQRLQPA